MAAKIAFRREIMANPRDDELLEKPSTLVAKFPQVGTRQFIVPIFSAARRMSDLFPRSRRLRRPRF
jgi:hypothetical protein